MKNWRPDNWENPYLKHFDELAEKFPSQAMRDEEHIKELAKIFESGADAIYQAIDFAITEAEFRTLDALGIDKITEEQAECFIATLRMFLGKEKE